MKLTHTELNERLNWNLNQKEDHSLMVIENMVNYSKGKVYASISGGLDSGIIHFWIKKYWPNTRCMFFNTTNEFPEIYTHLKKLNNVEWIQPGTNLKQIIEKYGFPLISKEQSQYINDVRHTKSEKFRQLRLNGRKGNQGKISNKWQFLINAPFEISDVCCYYLKKKPAYKFERETGLIPIIGTTILESRLRFQKYLKTGCNSFEGRKASYPLSIWTKKDSWEYTKKFNIPYCEIYDKGETQTGCMICGFGCHKDNRFERLKNYHPIAFDKAMNYKNNNITYRQALSYININI